MENFNPTEEIGNPKEDIGKDFDRYNMVFKRGKYTLRQKEAMVSLLTACEQKLPIIDDENVRAIVYMSHLDPTKNMSFVFEQLMGMEIRGNVRRRYLWNGGEPTSDPRFLYMELWSRTEKHATIIYERCESPNPTTSPPDWYIDIRRYRGDGDDNDDHIISAEPWNNHDDYEFMTIKFEYAKSCYAKSLNDRMGDASDDSETEDPNDY